MSIPQQLVALGIPERCIERRSSAQEKDRQFSIRPQTGDEIWRVHLDGCWLQDNEQKRVDYMFWARSASGHKSVLLVELKGKNFGKALEQIESTLEFLCKRSGRNVVHAAAPNALEHDPPSAGGVRAYVILSKGKRGASQQSKRGLPQQSTKRRKLQQRYGVIVYPHGVKLQVNGLGALLSERR